MAPIFLPVLEEPLEGASIVPWRYHFNTGRILSPSLSLSLLLYLRKSSVKSRDHMYMYAALVHKESSRQLQNNVAIVPNPLF